MIIRNMIGKEKWKRGKYKGCREKERERERE